jgi:hypothetical protein
MCISGDVPSRAEGHLAYTQRAARPASNARAPFNHWETRGFALYRRWARAREIEGCTASSMQVAQSRREGRFGTFGELIAFPLGLHA